MARDRKDKNRPKTKKCPLRHRSSEGTSFKRELAPESSAQFDSARPNLAQSKSVERLLQGIGTPDPNRSSLTIFKSKH
jgi:hypothetical protein